MIDWIIHCIHFHISVIHGYHSDRENPLEKASCNDQPAVKMTKQRRGQRHTKKTVDVIEILVTDRNLLPLPEMDDGRWWTDELICSIFVCVFVCILFISNPHERINIGSNHIISMGFQFQRYVNPTMRNIGVCLPGGRAATSLLFFFREY